MISWLRVSLAVWRCVELEPVLASAGADYARHWWGYIASLCAESLERAGANSGWKMDAFVAFNADFSTHCRRYPRE